MNYQKILNSNANITGVHAYDQSEAAVNDNVNIKGGVCRALVVMWLLGKKKDQNFWSDYGQSNEDETKPLISTTAKAVNLQNEYAALTQGRYIPDPTTTQKLAAEGLKLTSSDITASARFGYATQAPNDETQKIADKVLNASSRFFILSIQGESGAHSIGLYRPKQLVGRSSTVYLFDPNIGEFSVSGSANVKSLLQTLNNTGYPTMKLDASYILWSFSE